MLAHRVIGSPMTLYRTFMAEVGSRTGNPEIDSWRRQNEPHLQRGLDRLAVAEEHGIQMALGVLRLRRFNTTPAQLEEILRHGLLAPEALADLEAFVRRHASISEFGLASVRVVTTAGVQFLVDCFQGTTEPELMRYHGLGTGSTAEAVGDTALVTELTTQYNPDNTRATGTLTEGASANVFRTVGTNAVDAAVALREHGIFSQSATGGGVLLDRSVFAEINLASGNSLQSTYDFTITAGS